MKPELKPPGTERLKPKCDILLSSSAFKFNFRRYTMAPRPPIQLLRRLLIRDGIIVLTKRCAGRGLHSFTFLLNPSRL